MVSLVSHHPKIFNLFNLITVVLKDECNLNHCYLDKMSDVIKGNI